MKGSPLAAFTLLIAFTATTLLSAKGITTRISIEGGDLAAPLALGDPILLQQFNVWAGPGTRVDGVEGREGFIIDWSAGPVAEPARGVPPYTVSFFVKYPRQPDERLAYVVLYRRDASGGYVYLPGAADDSYRLNTRAIFRGCEGQWFRAAASWQDAVEPSIARARRR